MITSYNMLSQYVDIKKDPKQLAYELTMNGFEVEEMKEYPTSLSPSFIVGKVLEKEKHPDADKLWLCQIDIKKEILPIVCGAQNFKVGDHVVVATIGTVMPNGMEIKETTLKGKKSMGMLCSTKELGLYDAQGLWILPSESQVGESINPYLPLKDTIFDIAITPNRGDVLGTLGLSREVAIIENTTSLNTPSFDIKENDSLKPFIVNLHTKDCKRYTTRIIKGICVKESPDWLKIALKKYNINSINNIVDLGNYIMMETGQPVHIFDLNKLKGSLSIENLNKPEEFITLAGENITLPTGSLVVKDEKQTLALAGIIGGQNSGVSEDTQDILIESAFFDANIIRSIGQILHIYTDASYRFSRETDIKMTSYACDFLTDWILKLSGGEASCLFDYYPNPSDLRVIEITQDFIEQKLGFQLESVKLESIFKLLQFDFEKKDAQYLITIPSYRNDCHIPIDIVEEVIRIYGYEHLPTANPSIHNSIENGVASTPLMISIKNLLVNLGLYDTYHFSYTTEKKDQLFKACSQKRAVEIENPLNQDFAFLRTNLLSGMMEDLSAQYKKGTKSFAFFDIGNIFYYDELNKVNQETHLAIAMSGDKYPFHYSEKAPHMVDFFDLKGVIETLFEALGIQNQVSFEKDSGIDFLHTHKGAMILYQNQKIGYLGELHPQLANKYKLKQNVYLLEMDITSLLETMTMIQQARSFKAISKHPGTVRDFAFIVNQDQQAAPMVNDIKALSELIQDVQIVDLYQPIKGHENSKSIAFQVSLQSFEKTLVEEEIQNLSQKIINKMEQQYQAILRDK